MKRAIDKWNLNNFINYVLHSGLATSSSKGVDNDFWQQMYKKPGYHKKMNSL